ncbi:ribonuclease Z [Candidatus Pacearchaeota archaeon]|nr:ribonuclease Z [Candidatus Pacearchaeota archaeon]
MTEKAKITFLGTSDSVPSAVRNHPAVLLTYFGENILIDCGEGTQRQIRKAKKNPCKITRILITHWHADHVLGIPGLLKTLALSGYNKTLFVYGPKGTSELMKNLLNLFGIQKEYPIVVKDVIGKFFENEDFSIEAESMTHRIPCNAYKFILKGKMKIDKKKLNRFKISEGPHLKNLKEGKNISYAGKKYSAKNLISKERDRIISFVLDTSFNSKITPFVKNSDIFVCESTFTSELEAKAKEYQHLTVSQVAKIAKKAKIRKLFLTHISQRFSRNLKKVLEEAKKIFKESYLPFDLDIVEI